MRRGRLVGGSLAAMLATLGVVKDGVVEIDVHPRTRHEAYTYRQFVDVGSMVENTGLDAHDLIRFSNTPAVELTNANDVQAFFSLPMPAGVVSLDIIRLVLIERSGAVAGGDAMLAVGYSYHTGGGESTGYTSSAPAAVAIPAEDGSDHLRSLTPPQPAIAGIGGNDYFARILAQRNASLAGDTFEDHLWLVGVLLDWTVRP